MAYDIYKCPRILLNVFFFPQGIKLVKLIVPEMDGLKYSFLNLLWLFYYITVFISFSSNGSGKLCGQFQEL